MSKSKSKIRGIIKSEPLQLEQIKEDLRRLRLKDIINELDDALLAAQEGQQGYLGFLQRLVSCQVQAVHCRSVERRIKKACLYKAMSFECFDWNFQPELNAAQVKDLSELSFIVKNQPVLILGKSGTGKTHLATALGIRACQKGCRVKFYSFQQLLNHLYASLADETTEIVLDKMARLDLLIIDEVRHIRIKPEYASLFLDLVNRCQHRLSIVITSNISIHDWGQTLGNASITSAIVDRLLHNACVINIRHGRSYRTQGPNAPELLKIKEESKG
jgi:DNA replication protein DnaC